MQGAVNRDLGREGSRRPPTRSGRSLGRSSLCPGEIESCSWLHRRRPTIASRVTHPAPHRVAEGAHHLLCCLSPRPRALASCRHQRRLQLDAASAQKMADQKRPWAETQVARRCLPATRCPQLARLQRLRTLLRPSSTKSWRVLPPTLRGQPVVESHHPCRSLEEADRPRCPCL